MKDKVKEMFAQVTMPENTEEKILNAVAKGRKPKRHYIANFASRAATVAAILALVLVLSPTARAAVEGWVLKYVFPESGLSVYAQTDAEGNEVGVMVVDTLSESFAQYRDGRLYVSYEGEEWDITDQITEEEPYFYEFVDEYGLTHYRAVGYSGSLDNFGIYEFVRTVEEGQGPREGWEGGSGRNFLSAETEQRYPWVDIVWEKLGVPWPMPEGISE